jgi:hypothetical protein
MEPTPLEHDVFAVAAKCTGPCTVTPFEGLFTVIPANAAGAQMADRQRTARICFDIELLQLVY